MEQILVFLLILSAAAIIALVLMQQGKGADVGAAFGSGASNTVFGSQGSGSFLMKLTMGLAAVFFIICILLARLSVENSKTGAQLQVPTTQTQQTVPAQPAKAPASSVPAVPAKKN